MLRDSKFPILEFDDNPDAVINPTKPFTAANVSKYCVLCFLQEVIDIYKTEYDLKQIASVECVKGSIPIYQFKHKDKEVIIVQPGLGSAFSAGVIEEIIALGCSKFIVSGTCGVLLNDIKPGEVIVPTSAIRDEGVSYHYLPPSREVSAQEHINDIILSELKKADIPYREGKVWTTDAFYRETKEKVLKRKTEGCVAVEMEAAAMFAIAQFRKVDLGYILIGADDVSGETWDQRKGKTPLDFRRAVIDLCLDTVLLL